MTLGRRHQNPLSATTKALHLFSSKLRDGLTGTAIKNNLEGLWCVILDLVAPFSPRSSRLVASRCLLDWANKGQVGVKNTLNFYIPRPLKFAQMVEALDETLAIGRLRASALVTRLLPHFCTRRQVVQRSVAE